MNVLSVTRFTYNPQYKTYFAYEKDDEENDSFSKENSEREIRWTNNKMEKLLSTQTKQFYFILLFKY